MKHKIVLTFCLFQLITLAVCGQSASKTSAIIDSLKTEKGTIFVQMGKDALKDNTRISFYKSLVLYKEDAKITSNILQALTFDTKNKTSIAEVKKNGVLTSGNYYLGYNSKRVRHEYILYKRTDKKVTVIFLAGNFLPEDFESELGKLKQLFISINNGRHAAKGLDIIY